MDSLIAHRVPGFKGFVQFTHVPFPGREQIAALRIAFPCESQSSLSRAVEAVKRILNEESPPWLTAISDEWVLDLDKLRACGGSSLGALDWLTGKAYARPELDTIGDDSYVALYVTPKSIVQPSVCSEILQAIQPNLRHFEEDHPDNLRVAFVMMKFGESEKQRAIFEVINDTLSDYEITAVRADTKAYHSDKLYNIMTYLHGCGFGIAVYDQIETQGFNPNVIVELGYMLALEKHVCLLKDKSMSLQTDFDGRLYQPFDQDNPKGTIPGILKQWIDDKRLTSTKSPHH